MARELQARANFPKFGKKKFSIRVCNKKEESVAEKIAVSSSVHLKKHFGPQPYVFGTINMSDGTITLSNRMSSGRNFPIDLDYPLNKTFVKILEASGFEQGVTYFGEDISTKTIKRVVFKPDGLVEKVTEHRAFLEDIGVKVL